MVMETPKNIDDALQILRHELNDEIENIAKTPLDEYICTEHHGIGRFIRNEWGLWSGSELQTWFKDKGIDHPDDMSSIILTSFHRTLNNQSINLNEQIKFHKKYWELKDLDSQIFGSK